MSILNYPKIGIAIAWCGNTPFALYCLHTCRSRLQGSHNRLAMTTKKINDTSIPLLRLPTPYFLVSAVWELLTGCMPYKGLMYGEVVERVVVSKRRPEWPPHTPPAYAALAARCWAHEPAARPPFAVLLPLLRDLIEQVR